MTFCLFRMAVFFFSISFLCCSHFRIQRTLCTISNDITVHLNHLHLSNGNFPWKMPFYVRCLCNKYTISITHFRAKENFFLSLWIVSFLIKDLSKSKHFQWKVQFHSDQKHLWNQMRQMRNKGRISLCLTLGSTLPESTWTVVKPKSEHCYVGHRFIGGSKFSCAANCLQSRTNGINHSRTYLPSYRSKQSLVVYYGTWLWQYTNKKKCIHRFPFDFFRIHLNFFFHFRSHSNWCRCRDLFFRSV